MILFFCSVYIQQTALKGVDFRLSGTNLSFLGCNVTFNSVVGITNFSGEFAEAISRVEE